MSKATKRKHVTKEILEDYYVPEDGEEIVKIICGRGNNLHEVETANGNSYLVSMPTKFRRNVWVKRGDYVIIEPIKEGNKVQGEIVYILYDKQIKYLKSENLWPSHFSELQSSSISKKSDDVKSKENTDKQQSCHNNTLEDISDDESSDDDLEENPNRRPMFVYEETTSESEECESENEQLDESFKKLDVNESG